MKTKRLFAAAIALLSVLSCQKGQQMEEPSIFRDNVITCTFAANDEATKTTTTDGTTPLWAIGDVVKIYDADNSENAKNITLVASGAETTADQGEISEDGKKFSFVKPEEWSENLCAIYPASAFAAFDEDGNAKITFAGQNGSFARANICAARTSATRLSFKNVGAILKFSSKSVRVTKVVVPVEGLADNFKISFDDDNYPSLESDESASRSNEFSIGNGSGAIYIGVPASDIAASSVFTYKTSSNATLGTYTTGSDNRVEANKIYNLGPMMGVLSGIFSVSDSKKVQFSRGNLQATVDAKGKLVEQNAWHFATNQYDYLGKGGANRTIGNKAGVVDLFGWSTDQTTAPYNNWGIHAQRSYEDGEGYYEGKFNDWGNNAIANGGNVAKLWRTMTGRVDELHPDINEWRHLLNLRTVNGGTGEGYSYRRATVNSVYGMILYPDNYKAQTTAESYTLAEWTKMEADGCVFLPAGGFRIGSYIYIPSRHGIYWSSSRFGNDNALTIFFNADEVTDTYDNCRLYGTSVRLVCDAN